MSGVEKAQLGAVGLVAASEIEIFRLLFEKNGVRVLMGGFGYLPNNSLGTDAMNQITKSFGSFKRLFDGFEPQFATDLLAVIWRVVAAVHCFFPKGDFTRQHRQV
jgi:hypothetical protein